MKYRIFIILLISLISGLLINQYNIYVTSIPLLINLMWFTCSFFIIIAFIIFGFILWKFFAIISLGIYFLQGHVVHCGNNIVILDQIVCEKKCANQLKLKYYNHNIEPGKKIKICCFLYGSSGKIIKVYTQKHDEISFLEKIRNYIKECIVHSYYKEFLYALLLGDRSYMESYSILQSNGIIHVLAISGLHISILMWWLQRSIRFLLNLSFYVYYSIDTNLVSQILAFLISVFYSIISLNSASTIRALIMCILGILIPKINTHKSLIITCFAMLIYNPCYINDLSFQMSCLATYAITIPKFQYNFIINEIINQLNVTSILLPFINIISPLTIIMNIIIIPLITTILLLSGLMIHNSYTIHILDYIIAFTIKIMTIPLPYISIKLKPIIKVLYFLSITLSIFHRNIIYTIIFFILILLSSLF